MHFSGYVVRFGCLIMLWSFFFFCQAVLSQGCSNLDSSAVQTRTPYGASAHSGAGLPAGATLSLLHACSRASITHSLCRPSPSPWTAAWPCQWQHGAGNLSKKQSWQSWAPCPAAAPPPHAASAAAAAAVVLRHITALRPPHHRQIACWLCTRLCWTSWSAGSSMVGQLLSLTQQARCTRTAAAAGTTRQPSKAGS